MIINHHFRVNFKAHNFNSSIIKKRFLPPVISISPVTFLSPTGLGWAPESIHGSCQEEILRGKMLGHDVAAA